MDRFTFLVTGLLDKPIRITINATDELEASIKIKKLYPTCTDYKLIKN